MSPGNNKLLVSTSAANYENVKVRLENNHFSCRKSLISVRITGYSPRLYIYTKVMSTHAANYGNGKWLVLK